MKKMSAVDQIKFGARGKAILAELEAHPEQQVKLVKVLKANGFDSLAALVDDLRKWNGGK